MSTAIQWTDETWNPVTGCTRVSEGCRNCYIERTPPFRMNGRKLGDPVQLHHDRLAAPLSWKKPRRVFVNSLSDLFHEDIPDEFLHEVFAIMALCSQHRFQILTKRPERMRTLLLDDGPDQFFWALVEGNAQRIYSDLHPNVDQEAISLNLAVHGPLPNVWLGVSVEDQQTADERIPILLQTPAAVRWVSAEPLLGTITFETVPGLNRAGSAGREMLDRFWVVAGGESGPGARPCDVAWIRSIVQQCKTASVRVFVKQLGSRWYDSTVQHGIRGSVVVPVESDWVWITQHDKKGGDPAEWPADLCVREWPR